MEAAWRSHRAYLVNLAYQMLGDVGEAEDVAQEAFLRLVANRPRRTSTTSAAGSPWSPAGCASTSCGRPAPATNAPRTSSRATAVAPTGPDPADRVTLDDEVREAMLELLRRLSPGERVSFVLHDVFADAVRRDRRDGGQAGRHLPSTRPTRTRQVHRRRARAHRRRRCRTSARHREVHHRVRQRRPRGVDRRAGSRGVGGRHRARRWALRRRRSITARMPSAATCFAISGHGATLVSGPVGEPVLLAFADRRLFAVIVLTMRDNRVFKIEASVDPTAAARPHDRSGCAGVFDCGRA